MAADSSNFIYYSAIASVISASIAFLSLIANLYYNYWRGPSIQCGKIRYATICNMNDATAIYIPLVFTNIGVNTGIIERVMILLDNLSDGTNRLVYLPYVDDFDLNQLKIPGALPSAVESPIHEIAIEPKSNKIKNILFINQTNFRFRQGKYRIKLYYKMSNSPKNMEGPSTIIDVKRDVAERKYEASSDPLATGKIEIPPDTINFDEWWMLFN